MEIKVQHEDGYTSYSFESRKVSFDVVTRDHKEFSVWSNRYGSASFPRGTLTVYWSIEELAARSATFDRFVGGLRAMLNMQEAVSQ